MEDQLPEVVLQSVLARTDARDCARAACVDRRWRRISGDEELWRFYCHRDFAVSSALDHQGRCCATFKAAYRSWRQVFGKYSMPLVERANQCLAQIKDWLKIHFIEVLHSLAPGTSSEEIEAAEAELGFHLPDPVRVFYHLCNGQEFQEDEVYDVSSSHITNHLGLLGGYYFYDHFVNVHVLPLRQAVKLTLAIVPKLRLPPGSRRMVIAASCKSVKFFFLDCDDGQVYVGTRNLQIDGEMMPCTPDQAEGHSKDGLLRWLEQYGHRLQTNMYGVRLHCGIRSISLFPMKEPLCTKAITRGVQVQSSALFVPEQSESEGDNENHIFSYSVCMRLLAQSSENHDFYLENTQLKSRHWIIKPDGFPKSEVRGEAVVGLYPLLQAGGMAFVYESCCSLKTKSGYIEGDFTFVPGRIAKPEGAEFAAYVARLLLEVSQYIF